MAKRSSKWMERCNTMSAVIEKLENQRDMAEIEGDSDVVANLNQALNHCMRVDVLYYINHILES